MRRIRLVGGAHDRTTEMMPAQRLIAIEEAGSHMCDPVPPLACKGRAAGACTGREAAHVPLPINVNQAEVDCPKYG